MNKLETFYDHFKSAFIYMKEANDLPWRATNIKHLIKNTLDAVRFPVCVPINDVFC